MINVRYLNILVTWISTINLLNQVFFLYISGDFWTYRLKGLQAHIRVVHKKVRNISCDLCDQRFVATRDKLKHMAKQHAVGIAEKWNCSQNVKRKLWLKLYS